jgi:hypothetical protein
MLQISRGDEGFAGDPGSAIIAGGVGDGGVGDGGVGDGGVGDGGFAEVAGSTESTAFTDATSGPCSTFVGLA